MNNGRLLTLPRLGILIPTCITMWAVACCFTHGPAILGYVALQAATSGLFALAMYRVERTIAENSKPQLVTQAVTVSNENRFAKAS